MKKSFEAEEKDRYLQIQNRMDADVVPGIWEKGIQIPLPCKTLQIQSHCFVVPVAIRFSYPSHCIWSCKKKRGRVGKAEGRERIGGRWTEEVEREDVK